MSRQWRRAAPFEFAFAAGALRQFIAVGNQALAGLDELTALQCATTRRLTCPN